MSVVVPKKPYVYGLTDPNGNVFYIGKGNRRRMFAHANEARKGKPGEKCDFIRSVWQSGKEIGYLILGEYETDAEACDAEVFFISHYASLTNITKGGESKPVDYRQRIIDQAKSLFKRLNLPSDHWLAIAIQGQIDNPAPTWIRYCPVNGISFGYEPQHFEKHPRLS